MSTDPVIKLQSGGEGRVCTAKGLGSVCVCVRSLEGLSLGP